MVESDVKAEQTADQKAMSQDEIQQAKLKAFCEKFADRINQWIKANPRGPTPPIIEQHNEYVWLTRKMRRKG